MNKSTHTTSGAPGRRPATAFMALCLALALFWGLALAAPLGAMAATGTGTEADPIIWDMTEPLWAALAVLALLALCGCGALLGRRAKRETHR